jgi:hypothetical protein
VCDDIIARRRNPDLQERHLRKFICAAVLLLALSISASAQIAPPTPDWSSWNWIIGTWDGKAAGKPGSGTGSFSLLYSLDHAVLVRKSLSNYRAPKTAAKTHHEDFMVVYEENGHWRADYWDTERHVIHYTITMGEGVATFVSEKTPHSPTFRLIYKRMDKGALSVEFATAAAGSDIFKPYVSGICERRPGS